VDQKELRELEAVCIQEEPPACRAGCPVGVDARAFTLAMARSDFDGARQILEKSMPMAELTARLCEAPCEEHCLRKDLGGAIALGGLEKVCIREGRSKSKIMRLPARPKKVAVIGSGPSSLTVAFDLAKKGYPVTIYHLPPGPGAWLRALPETELPSDLFRSELDRLVALKVVFEPVETLDVTLLEQVQADAIYVGQDDTVSSELSSRLGSPDQETQAVGTDGWFTGGIDLTESAYRYITAVSHGRESAVSIDRFLQNASLTSSRVSLRAGQTRLYTKTEGIPAVARIEPGSTGYSATEAAQEAARCLDCQCMECVKHCQYMQDYDGYPKSFVRRVFNNLSIVQGMRQANKFINSCSLCGQCETICPNDFSMASMCLDGRRQMVREGRMPPSAHWFALEEMKAAASDQAFVLRHAPGKDSSAMLFFPGCQLSGIRPEQTMALYDHLLATGPATGLWLSCCGAPAHWSGREQEFSAWAAQLETQWKEMGQPTVITACSTCLAIFREHLPQFGAVSVWTLVRSIGAKAAEQPLALSDPCTSRHDKATRETVRRLLAAMGQDLADLPMSGEMTECCGYGGLMDNANPELARRVAKRRVDQSVAPFLTYCAMCRDQLAKTGKPVLHILDLLFPQLAHDALEGPAGISARRTNRRSLKTTVLGRYNLDGMPRQPWEDIPLLLDGNMSALLEDRRILQDDVRQVLYQARQSGRYFRHSDGRRIASAVLGEVTFWVEYREQGEAVELITAWSHRMRIGGGQS